MEKHVKFGYFFLSLKKPVYYSHRVWIFPHKKHFLWNRLSHLVLNNWWGFHFKILYSNNFYLINWDISRLPTLCLSIIWYVSIAFSFWEHWRKQVFNISSDSRNNSYIYTTMSRISFEGNLKDIHRMIQIKKLNFIFLVHFKRFNA